MTEKLRSVRHLSFALWAMAVMSACGSSTASVRATSTMAPTSTSVIDATVGTLVLADKDNGTAAVVRGGQRITVTLASTYWHFAPSATQVLSQERQPAYAPGGPGCPKIPGTGCGTVEATFTAVAAGETNLAADRTSCGEALVCSDTQAHWRFHVRVLGPVPVPVPITPPVSVTTTAVTATTITGFPTTTVPPASTSTIASGLGATGVRGTVLFGPVCPVERVPPDPQCAPRPGVARIRVLRPDGSAAAEGVSVFVDGRFLLPVTPGTYQVTAAPSAPGPGRGCQAEPLQVTVVAGYFANVSVTCDTGIR